MAATIGQKHKNGFKIVEIWDNHSESLKNNMFNDFKGLEHLLGGMNLENEIDTCQTTVGHKVTFATFPLKREVCAPQDYWLHFTSFYGEHVRILNHI